MNENEMKQLEKAITEITEIATSFGLDFYPMRYEVCPADIIYTFGAYGMPTRFSHWSFGKIFHKMKVQYDLGLSKIYELVINSNPCYAFLLEGNSLIQNKLIVAHVLAHSDFFKNNVKFKPTNRDMLISMSSTADRIHDYSLTYGTHKVEHFLDAALAIQEHVDPRLIQPPAPMNDNEVTKDKTRPAPYADLWKLDKIEIDKSIEKQIDLPQHKPFPPEPEKDIVHFIEQHSPVLEEWQRDILSMMREEMLYFWPQIETKIMNEGWASYWHVRILREMDLTEEETVEFAKLNAAVVQPSTHQLNPYYLGLKIFEDIEHRFGREKMFEVRELDSDISFLRNHLTKDLVRDLDLYVFEKQGAEWKITDKTWESIRDQLVTARVNGGFPYLVIEDANYLRNGELYLKHRFEGTELDLKYLEKTLPYVYQLWGKVVHLETMIEQKRVLFTFDGHKQLRKFL